MIYAIDENKNKVKAIPNSYAICPNCNAEMIAKCGEYNIWHWAHKNSFDCDSWVYEPITEWHLKWQGYFKEEEREVYIKKTSQSHIADILTKNGVVIEFQNSPIAPDTIFERESFYSNMIWVVNTIDFKQNFIFKNFPSIPHEPIWEMFIRKHHPNEKISYTITIPIDDFNGQILKSLKKCNYKNEPTDEDENDSWYKIRESSHEELDIAIVNAFESYLIDCTFRQELDDDRIYATNFKWKNMRKRWKDATKPIYFDLNNGFLFERKTLHESGNGFGQILSKRAFRKLYTN